MRLTVKFFIWNVTAVVLSLGLSALAVVIFAAFYARSRGLELVIDEVMRFRMIAPAEDDLPSSSIDATIDLYIGAAITGVCFFILCFLLLNWLVSRRFSRGIIEPLIRLTDSATKISEGDLAGGIAVEGEGELQALCRSLEQMRIKLKESIYMQERYDDNRKFLLSSISHDLKTPVTAIRGYIEGIIDGVASTPEKQRHYLETARQKAIQVNNMIDDLLLYSRLDMNQLPYYFEKTDLLRYAEDCVEEHRYGFEQSGVTLTLVNELPSQVQVRIDRERFKRVMQNVLDNARKHSGGKQGSESSDIKVGRVDLVLRETATSAIIEVRDNGEGIPEEHLPHLFDRFYRADPSRSNVEGSGLGLAIAKQIVEGHEGRIWVTSKAGEGTRVMISLQKL